MIKYGLKIWNTDETWFSQAVDLIKRGVADFAEIYLVPDSFSLTDFDIFKQNNIAVNLHAPHTTHNFDIFDLNEKSLAVWQDQVIKTADYLQSNFIVVHPGTGDSKEIFEKEVKKIKDKRVLMETMIKKGFFGVKEGGVNCFGYSQSEIEFINKQCGFEICLDFGHSMASAAWQGIDGYQFVDDLINNFKPRYFHLSGGFITDKTDQHLNIYQGDFDFAWLKEKIKPLAEKEDIYLVFETPKQSDNLENDVKNIEYFKDLTGSDPQKLGLKDLKGV